jgi:hypothetical protein
LQAPDRAAMATIVVANAVFDNKLAEAREEGTALTFRAQGRSPE